LPNSNLSTTLLTAAEAYFHLGFSVIPLLGDLDPSRPKIPAIAWGGFQRCRASINDYKQWFTEMGFGGLGIVTGRASHLVVLDFDSEELFNNFRIQYPDLVETHTVRSAGRQLPHLYFKLPSHLNLPSKKGQGIDLLSDGRYVVAPPTSISGQSYKITRGGMPKVLLERDIRRIETFMRSSQVKTPQNPQKFMVCNNLRLKTESALQDMLTPTDLQALYHHHLQKHGRNESLFLSSLRARDCGWTQKQTEESLISLHSQQTSIGSHHHETPAQRQREAQKTIRSAFSRPARPIQSHTVHKQGVLSNSVREALMQKGMTYVVRTYEGLLHAGLHLGQVFSSKEAVERLKGLVGRDSVLKALKSGQGDKRFFPPCTPHYVVANDNSLIKSKKCFFEGSRNQLKPQGGRPSHLLMMPSNEELCAILGVRVTGSDPLEQADLASARKTRMALHRELIKRRPGQYPLGWMAHRLGVNRRTIFTYNQLIPIHSRAMFIETPINWKTIERLPFDEPISGAVLVTQAGKRYPALRTVASRLLAAGEAMTLRQQTASFYWFGDEPIIEHLHVQQETVIRQERIETFIAKQPPAPVAVQHKPVSLAPPLPTRPVVKQDRVSKKSLASINCRKPFNNPSRESLAQQIYTTLNAKTGKSLSLVTARRLVSTYSTESIHQALALLQQRQSIIYPTGFFITILRRI
jgi:hypothetical protein